MNHSTSISVAMASWSAVLLAVGITWPVCCGALKAYRQTRLATHDTQGLEIVSCLLWFVLGTATVSATLLFLASVGPLWLNAIAVIGILLVLLMFLFVILKRQRKA
jgi:hypothetical protein